MEDLHAGIDAASWTTFKHHLIDYRAAVSDPVQKEFAGRFLGLLAEGRDQAFLRTHTPAHFTASCVLCTEDYSRILMTLHRKLGIWLQLGGHADGDTDLARVALKEGQEESGLKHLTLRPVPNGFLDLDIHEIPAHKGEPVHFHFDARFLFTTPDPNKIVLSEESVRLEWFDLKATETMPLDVGLRRVIQKIQKDFR